MKYFRYIVPIGTVDVTVDQFGSVQSNLTVMEVNCRVTDPTLLSTKFPLAGFYNSFHVFANLKKNVSSIASLMKVASDNSIALYLADPGINQPVLLVSANGILTEDGNQFLTESGESIILE